MERGEGGRKTQYFQQEICAIYPQNFAKSQSKEIVAVTDITESGRNIPSSSLLFKNYLPGSVYRVFDTVFLLGCRTAEIPLNIFIGCINGRQVHLSVRKK